MATVVFCSIFEHCTFRMPVMWFVIYCNRRE